MIRTLQKKFILTAMAAVSVLLVVAMGAVSVASYVVMEGQTGHLMEMIIQEQAREKQPIQPPPEMEKVPGLFAPPFDGEVMKTARYFLVIYDEAGEIAGVDISPGMAVTEEEAWQFAEKVGAGQEMAEGRTGQLRYQTVRTRQGTMTVFLDVSAETRFVLLVAGLALLIGLVCWAVMLLLVIFLSRRAIRPIAENMERQKQFVTDAGHEIKTPLAIILANTDAMELHTGENKWSRNIRAQTERLSGLTKNLLALAKMDERGVRMSTERVELSDLLAGTADQFRESAARRGIEIRTDIAPGLILEANQEMVCQLFCILLDNGVKYADEGTALEISLTRTERRGIRLRMRNRCAALPKVKPERLFDRFYRGDGARTQSGEKSSYGIGLSSARAIAEAHRGTITASYGEGNTITFTVTFSRVRNHQQP